MQHFYSFVSQVTSLLLSPRFGACTAGVRPFPLAMQHFYSFLSHAISLLLSPRFGACTAGWCPPFSAGHAFICLPSDFFPKQGRKQVAVRGSQCFLRVSALLRDSVSAFRPACLPLSPFLLVTVSALSGHCVRFVSLLSPFVSLLVSGLVSLLVGHCVRLVSLLSPVVSPFLLVTVPALVIVFALSSFLFAFLLVIVSVLSPICFLLSPFLLVTVSVLSPFCFLLSPFLSCGHCLPSCPPSCWSLCPPCLPSCLRSCLPSCWPLCLLLSPFLSSVLFPFLLVTVSGLSPFCLLLSPFLSPFLLVIVSVLSAFLSPFLLVTVSALLKVALGAETCGECRGRGFVRQQGQPVSRVSRIQSSVPGSRTRCFGKGLCGASSPSFGFGLAWRGCHAS